MPKLFDLKSFRILAVGGAKASTNGFSDEMVEEPTILTFDPN